MLIGLLADSVAAGAAVPAEAPLTETARRAIAPIRPVFPATDPRRARVRRRRRVDAPVGSISFELFGHTANVVAEAPALRAAFHLHEMTFVGRRLGLLPPG